MIVVYARSRWPDSASWTWRTVWGSREDQRWSITARSRSPRRVNLAMFRSSPTGSRSRVLRRYYVASYRTHENDFDRGEECSGNGHPPPWLGGVSRVTRGSPARPHDYSKANLTEEPHHRRCHDSSDRRSAHRGHGDQADTAPARVQPQASRALSRMSPRLRRRRDG